MNCLSTLLKPCFINSLQGIGIGQKISKRSFEDRKLCRYNNGHHVKYDSLISDVVEMMEMKEMKDIPIQDYVKTRWIDLYPITQEMTQIFSFYVPVITSI